MVIFLNRNLRKSILQGHPWVYKEALLPISGLQGKMEASLAVLKDAKKQFLAWGIYDPHSPISFRVLSLKDKKPDENFFAEAIKTAAQKRRFLTETQTNAFRWVNGEGDYLPGLVCDVYHNVAVLQFDGKGPEQFWGSEKILSILRDKMPLVFKDIWGFDLQSIVIKERGASESLKIVYGEDVPEDLVIQENGLQFKIKVLQGQKTGFFLDQRDNRNYIRSQSKDKTVLNLFSYTGGFSMYAGAGGAKFVASVDISKGAIVQAEDNWVLNQFAKEKHKGFAEDVFEFLESHVDHDEWDMIIVDPPSMTHSEKQKPQAITKYIEAFAKAARKVKVGGDLVLSSCSSHISFDDFDHIIQESLSQARRRGQILRISGQGSDHPFLHVHPEMKYLKFVHLCLVP
ncbi:MAG: class I SAM-dependent rRNA methyltransferase [Bdellovibrionaceae bacterium]|nr:class I SAM-dependent rRNA methyltransferase [Pseudobdellovibrionaceae bacterium]